MIPQPSSHQIYPSKVNSTRNHLNQFSWYASTSPVIPTLWFAISYLLMDKSQTSICICTLVQLFIYTSPSSLVVLRTLKRRSDPRTSTHDLPKVNCKPFHFSVHLRMCDTKLCIGKRQQWIGRRQLPIVTILYYIPPVDHTYKERHISWCISITRTSIHDHRIFTYVE